MHRSRLCAFVIDCNSENVQVAAEFWSAALGRPVLPGSADDPDYRALRTEATEPMLLLQKVDHPSRIHLDIESNDLEAEVARLEALGAKRIGFVKRWWVMEAPTGQRFCIVRAKRSLDDAPGVNVWT